MLSNPIRVQREIAGRTLTLETGRLAKQANGSVFVQYGDSAVLMTVCCATARPDIDFFPLTVEYREKTAAVGKVPGGFFKREGRPTTKEILAMRLIDRAIRPMFAEGYREEIQIIGQVSLRRSGERPRYSCHDRRLRLLQISEIPFLGPMGSTRIGYIAGKLVVNPTRSELKSPDSKLDLVVAGTREAIAMVEAGASEIDEEIMLEALELGHKVAIEVADLIGELRREMWQREKAVAAVSINEDLKKQVFAKYRKGLRFRAQDPRQARARERGVRGARARHRGAPGDRHRRSLRRRESQVQARQGSRRVLR